MLTQQVLLFFYVVICFYKQSIGKQNMFLVMNNKPGYVSQVVGLFDTRLQAGNEILKTIDAFNKDGDFSIQEHYNVIEIEPNKNYITL